MRGRGRHALRSRLLALQQPPVRIDLELERGLVSHQLVVVGHQLVQLGAQLGYVAIARVQREPVVAPRLVQVLLELRQAHDEVGVDLLELVPLALRVAQRALEAVRRLDLVDERVERVAFGHLLRDLLGLDAVPLLELALLLVAELLEVTAYVAYGSLELVTVELSRVDVSARLQRAQLLHLLLVDGVEERDLLLERLLLVLEANAFQRFLVQVGQQTLQVVVQSLHFLCG